MIDRQRVLSAFAEYSGHYDIQMNMIRLKVEHTYRVAALCERIAQSLELSKEDIDIAWLCGMLHDLGRFEQQKRYGTFNDAISIDHAAFSASLLFEEGLIRNYIDDIGIDALLQVAIANHSSYRIAENLSQRQQLFCHILRDADKIDILKVNVEFKLEEIYNCSTQELVSAPVTKEVLDSFLEEHAVLRSLKKTPVDNVVGHISLTFELVYPISVRILKEQGYLDKLIHFSSENEETQKTFAIIREKMENYLADY